MAMYTSRMTPPTYFIEDSSLAVRAGAERHGAVAPTARLEAVGPQGVEQGRDQQRQERQEEPERARHVAGEPHPEAMGIEGAVRGRQPQHVAPGRDGREVVGV